MTKDPTGAVVVSYEAGDALVCCVASLRAAGIDDVVVVDNGSRDGSLAALAAADSACRLVPNGRNLGYGRAANLAVARLPERCASVLVCNPDLLVEPDAPARLAAVLDEQPDVAVCGPALITGGALYPSARAFPSYGVAAVHAALGMFHPHNPWSRRYRMEAGAGDGSGKGEHEGASEAAERDADWVSGACMLVRRSAFCSVGGFDERYFMYVEDLDLCWRLRRAGWRIRYVPTARVDHEQGRSTARHPYRMLVAHHRSTWRFARRRAEGAERLLLPAVGCGLVVRLGVAIAREAAAGCARGSATAARGSDRPVDGVE